MFADARIKKAVETVVSGVFRFRPCSGVPSRRASRSRNRSTPSVANASVRRSRCGVHCDRLCGVSGEFARSGADRRIELSGRHQGDWVDASGRCPKILGAARCASRRCRCASALGLHARPAVRAPGRRRSLRVWTGPTQIYTKATRVWKTGPAFATFTYRRLDGRSFSILATEFDPQTGTPSKYMFESQDLPGGRTALIRHEQFTWRNGDQVTSIVEGDDISASEIESIRRAMNGVPIEGVYPSRHDGKVIKRYLAPPGAN